MEDLIEMKQSSDSQGKIKKVSVVILLVMLVGAKSASYNAKVIDAGFSELTNYNQSLSKVDSKIY
jgi:hypothetical protein